MERDELMAEIKKMLEVELKAYLEPMKKSLQDKIPEGSREKAQAAKDSLSAKIQENPLQSAALALIAGFVIARFIYKKSKDET